MCEGAGPDARKQTASALHQSGFREVPFVSLFTIYAIAAFGLQVASCPSSQPKGTTADEKRTTALGSSVLAGLTAAGRNLYNAGGVLLRDEATNFAKDLLCD